MEIIEVNFPMIKMPFLVKLSDDEESRVNRIFKKKNLLKFTGLFGRVVLQDREFLIE